MFAVIAEPGENVSFVLLAIGPGNNARDANPVDLGLRERHHESRTRLNDLEIRHQKARDTPSHWRLFTTRQ